MILGEPLLAAAELSHDLSRVTIEALFRHVAKRRPDALALADAANRASFTGGEPRRLTYAEAERIVTAIAGRLRGMGLSTDAIVGIQLPNIVENILAMLGVLRAGMILAPLPLLWRRADVVTALARIGAKALITCGRVGAFNHGQFAMRVAAEVFSIRYVCGFGKNLPDGVVSFDDLLAAEMLNPVLPLDRGRQNAAAHVAAITFDIGEGGVLPVARNHAELFAGGLAVLLESRPAPEANILSALVPASFAGISLTLLPWLLSDGALVLHHPFDPHVLARQSRDDRCSTLVLPGPVALHLAEAGVFAGPAPACVIAAWRAPERAAEAPAWQAPNIAFINVPIFGEAALVAARRGTDGRPMPFEFGPVTAPHGAAGGIMVAELIRTHDGRLAVRGPMVPHHFFPPGIERTGVPYFQIGPGGEVDTGFECQAASETMVITGPPAGIVNVGSYRFPLRDLQDLVGRIDGGASLAALPDPVMGQRLIGEAANPDKMQAALNAAGVNPLVAAAFRNRSGRDLAATAADAA
jgi:AMP-binding enzyme